METFDNLSKDSEAIVFVENNERVIPVNQLTPKKMREILGCSQETFGQILGVSVSTISRWERKKFNPSKFVTRRLGELMKLVTVLKSISKDPVEYKDWLRTPNEELNFISPLTKMIQPNGIDCIITMLYNYVYYVKDEINE